MMIISESEREEFTRAIAETEDEISMNLTGANKHNRELAISFARSFSDITDEQAEQIKQILLGGKKE